MTSGVKWNEDYSDPNSDVNLCHGATDQALGSPLITYLARLPREAEAGSKFVYKTAETDLAGEIVIAATGKPLAEYLSDKIWSQAGMERDAYWMLRGGKELGGCCLSMSLRDYARFALFFLHGGVVNGKHLLPPGWTKDAVTPTDVSRAAIARNGGHGGYGYQWWLESDAPGTYCARGIFGQSIYLDPAEDLIIVTLSAWPTPLDVKRRAATIAFEAAVNASLH
jgi:CubicO group peptidase (beta-lactamase class C family)